jgi:Poly(ADP-ribose) polymerase and DNA-Ligase Zn-finger region
MAHVIEAASTGRAKCRACGGKIAAGELRFGERLPNPFADGEITQWFHLECGAFARPEPFLEALGARTEPLEDAGRLEAEARLGLAHHRVPRIRAVERSPSGRARCRSCREAIAKDAWRITLAFYEEGRFVPSGCVHVGCARAYFETADILPRVRRFSPALSDDDLQAIAKEMEA